MHYLSYMTHFGQNMQSNEVGSLVSFNGNRVARNRKKSVYVLDIHLQMTDHYLFSIHSLGI